MILISHNCLSGHLYRLLKQKYTCPFIWTVIDFNSMKTLITEWNKINFKNYNLEKDNNWNFSLIIDNKIKVQYVHYKFDPSAKTLIKKGPGNIYYNKIWEYIINCYEKRSERMIKDNIEPIFCIANFNTIYSDAIYSEKQLNELSQYKNVKILKGFEKKEPYETAKFFYNKYLNKV